MILGLFNHFCIFVQFVFLPGFAGTNIFRNSEENVMQHSGCIYNSSSENSYQTYHVKFRESVDTYIGADCSHCEVD